MKRILFHFFIVSLLLAADIDAVETARETPSTSRAMRIISLAPNITEILFALHAEKYLVGVSEFDTFPAKVKQYPSVGGLLNPDIEKIISLRPDIIISVSGANRLKRKLAQMNIHFWEYHSETLDDIFHIIHDLGMKLNCRNEAEHLVMQIKNHLSNMPDVGRHRRVLIVVGTTPGTLRHIFVAGGTSFLDTLLRNLGFENVFHAVAKPFFEVSGEAVFERAPDVIIEFAPGCYRTHEAKTERRETWGYFSTIPAVLNHQIYIFSEDFILIPGPRIMDTASLIAKTLIRRCPSPAPKR